MSDWHYQHNGETKGPVDDAQLKALAEAGVVDISTPVWKTGYANWVALSQTDFPYLASAGPPPTAGAGGAALAGGASSGQFAGEYVVDDRSIWGHFKRAITERYAQFTGRSRRKEYWSDILLYVIFLMVVTAIGLAIDAAAGNFQTEDGRPPRPIFVGIVIGIYTLGLLVPSIAIVIRRLHDIGLSGWLILISFIPYLGGIALLVMMLIPTQFGPNKHGPAPKAPKSV